MDKKSIFVLLIITIIVVGFVVFYYTVQNVCAADISCVPTPYVTIIPSEIPTPTQVPIPTAIPPTMSPSPSAGQSAAIVLPSSPPDTGY